MHIVDWASLNGRCDVIEVLLEHKGDANLKNDFGHIALEGALQNGFTDAAVITSMSYFLIHSMV